MLWPRSSGEAPNCMAARALPLGTGASAEWPVAVTGVAPPPWPGTPSGVMLQPSLLEAHGPSSAFPWNFPAFHGGGDGHGSRYTRHWPFGTQKASQVA